MFIYYKDTFQALQMLEEISFTKRKFPNFPGFLRKLIYCKVPIHSLHGRNFPDFPNIAQKVIYHSESFQRFRSFLEAYLLRKTFETFHTSSFFKENCENTSDFIQKLIGCIPQLTQKLLQFSRYCMEAHLPKENFLNL